MSENRKPAISALMDGELGGDAAVRVIAEVGAEPAALTTWHHFHLIGDALRGEPLLANELSLAPGVMAALEHEVTVLAPRRRESLSRRVLTGAIAASVAALAVFTLQGRIAGVEPGSAPGLAAVASPATTQPVTTALATTAAPSGEAGLAARPVEANDLQRYFMNHNELRAVQSMRPLPPHASLVGFSPQPSEPRPLPAAAGAGPAR